MAYDEGGAAPPGKRRPRRRLLALAIPAAVLVAGASIAAAQLVRHQGDASEPTAVVFTYADLALDDPWFRLGPDQVPSIAGLTATQAETLLESNGYRVSVVDRSACPAAGDVFVVPGPGTIAAHGSTVTLHRTTIPPNVSCAVGPPDDRVMAFLAWARGLGPEPRFAPSVTVRFSSRSASGGSTRSLRGATIADHSQWPGLDSLADVLRVPVRGRSGLIPLVATAYDSTCAPTPGGTCPDEPGVHLGGSQGDTNAAADTASQFDVMLEISPAGRITAVVLADHRTADDRVGPDVVGDSAAFATARLRAFQLRVATVETDDCAQRGQVVAAMPDGPAAATIRISRGGEACAG